MPGFDDPYIPRMVNFGGHEGAFGSATGVIEGLDRLSDSVKHLQLSRSISAANDELSALSLQDASEHDMTQRRNELAQQLGQQMIASGFPASSVQTLQQTFRPVQQKPQYSNIPEIAAYGSDEQRQNLLDFYAEYKPPKELDQAAVDLKNEKAQDARDKIYDAQRTKLADKVNQAMASGRNVRGQLATRLAKLQEIKQGLLAGDKATLNSLTLPETAASLSSIFTGGTGTVSGTEHLLPASLNRKQTDLQNYLTGGLKPYNIPAVVKGYTEIIDRLGNVIPAQQNEMAKNTMRGELNLAKKDTDKFSNIAESHITNPDGTKDVARVEKGRVRFLSDDRMDELEDGLKWVMKNAKSDPAKAREIFNGPRGIKENPFYMQALQRNPNFSKLVIGAGRALGGE